MTGTTPIAPTLLADRAVLRLSGEDVRGFLQGLVTADAGGALPAWAGLLTPQGKALFDFLLWADGEDGSRVLIDCEAAQADALARRLTMYRLRRAITITRADDLAVHWAPPGAAASGGGAPDPRLAALGTRWLARRKLAGPIRRAPMQRSGGGRIASPSAWQREWRSLGRTRRCGWRPMPASLAA